MVRMEFRQQPEKPSNFFGRDEAGPHDEQLEAAATADARVAVIKKAMLGCELTSDELETAHLTQDEAVHEAGLLLERTETQRKYLTEPPKPAEPQRIQKTNLGGTAEVTSVYTVDVEPEPAPKRRKKRDTKSFMRRAIEHRHEERNLFED